MRYFIQVTAIVAVAIVGLIVLWHVFQILILAAVIAALIVGVLAVRNVLTRRRGGVPTITYRR